MSQTNLEERWNRMSVTILRRSVHGGLLQCGKLYVHVSGSLCLPKGCEMRMTTTDYWVIDTRLQREEIDNK